MGLGSAIGQKPTFARSNFNMYLPPTNSKHDALKMLVGKYSDEVSRGIEEGTIQLRKGAAIYSSRQAMIRTYRTRATTLSSSSTEYGTRLWGEIMELLTRLESTSEQEIGLVIYEEVHTAKNYIAFVGKNII